MAKDYKVGAKVRLNVGGPTMAVSQVNQYRDGSGTTYHCQWFAGKKLDKGIFPHESLIPVQDDVPAPSSGQPAPQGD